VAVGGGQDSDTDTEQRVQVRLGKGAMPLTSIGNRASFSHMFLLDGESNLIVSAVTRESYSGGHT
jgi:hypothetical protein